MSALLRPPVPTAKQPSLSWHQLYGSAAALALAEAMQADPRLYIIVSDGARELERLSAELQFFSGELNLLTFPDWEVLPYDLFSPHPDITSQRLRALFELPRTKRGCLIVTADTLMQRLPPKAYVQARAFELKVGQQLGIEAFRDRLVEAGYASVSQVTSPGEFAMRGSLLDVFPTGSKDPLRIDLFDEDIEAIRRFDPESQRSLDSLDSVRLLPAREVPLDADVLAERGSAADAHRLVGHLERRFGRDRLGLQHAQRAIGPPGAERGARVLDERARRVRDRFHAAEAEARERLLGEGLVEVL